MIKRPFDNIAAIRKIIEYIVDISANGSHALTSLIRKHQQAFIITAHQPKKWRCRRSPAWVLVYP